MKKVFVGLVDKATAKVLTLNANSTTSGAAFQPKQPNELKEFSKFNK